jgi:hypothetical protein
LRALRLIFITVSSGETEACHKRLLYLKVKKPKCIKKLASKNGKMDLPNLE